MIGSYGFKSIKLKAGALPPAQEVAGLLALAEAFPGTPLRIDPNAVFSVNFPLYGGLKSFEGYNRHSIRGGVSVGEKVPVKLTLGLENLANATYFMPFQNGMSPGFSAVFGATIGWKKAF